MASGDPFFFAGLWDVWHDGAPDAIASFTILTTDPNEVAATVHNRMPVIVQAKDYERWLDPKIRDTEKIADILRPYPGGMVTYPISRRINSPKNEGAELIEPNEESGRGNAA
jgi:putative SOS response-associated peptidase YedK